MPFADIEVTVHPQSVVHSLVEFVDGSVIAQCSPPDMRLPIALGLSWPERLPDVTPACDWRKASTWQFEPLDETVFAAGLTYPAVYNAANEQAVEAFHSGRLSFLGIIDVIKATVDAHRPQADLSLEGVLAAEAWAREWAEGAIARG